MVFDAGGRPPVVEESGGRREVRRPLGELLIQGKVITADQLVEVLAAQREPSSEKKLGQLLIERGWLTEAQLTQTLSLQLSVPWVSLSHIEFSRQLLNRVPRELAEKCCLIPIFVRHVKGQGETLYVAMDDPTNEAALGEVSHHASLPARPMIASATDIRSAIRVYYGEPAGSRPVDVPVPEPRAEPPAEPRPVSQPPRPASQPPPPLSVRGAPAPEGAADEEGPLITSSHPVPGTRAAALVAAATEIGIPAPRAAENRPVPRAADSEARRGRGRMLSLTLLDGTRVQVPSPKNAKGPEGLTARDYISALRATAHGADASEVLGEAPRWEPIVAALLSILLRKGLIADWELMEELRKI